LAEEVFEIVILSSLSSQEIMPINAAESIAK
jgi:hypothetical protein